MLEYFLSSIPSFLSNSSHLDVTLVDNTPDKAWCNLTILIPALTAILSGAFTAFAVYWSGKMNSKAVEVSAEKNANAALVAAQANAQTLRDLKDLENNFNLYHDLKNKKLETVEMLCEAWTEVICAQDCLRDIDRVFQEFHSPTSGKLSSNPVNDLHMRRLEQNNKLSEAHAKKNLGLARLQLYFNYPDVNDDYQNLHDLFLKLEADGPDYEILEQEALTVLHKVKQYI